MTASVISYPGTKERLLEIAQRLYSLSPTQMKDKFMQAKLPMPFDENAWTEYIQCLSGQPVVCRVCCGPLTRVSGKIARSSRLYNFALQCVDHGEKHQITEAIAMMRAHYMGFGIYPDRPCKHSQPLAGKCKECAAEFHQATSSSIVLIMGNYCKCGKYLRECEECWKEFADSTLKWYLDSQTKLIQTGEK